MSSKGWPHGSSDLAGTRAFAVVRRAHMDPRLRPDAIVHGTFGQQTRRHCDVPQLHWWCAAAALERERHVHCAGAGAIDVGAPARCRRRGLVYATPQTDGRLSRIQLPRELGRRGGGRAVIDFRP